MPYWVYGGQQESGSAMVASRGNDGQITFREWHPGGRREYAYDRARSAEFRYRLWRRDGRQQHHPLGPRHRRGGGVRARGSFRHVRTYPVLFSPKDPHILYVGFQSVVKTADGGKTWETISPDLSREILRLPESVACTPTLAKNNWPRAAAWSTPSDPSPLDVNVLWAGTDDGLIHLTRDGGKNWKNVTPPALKPWSKVSQLDASHFDDRTVYAAINSFRLDDQAAHLPHPR
jgi:hypothetical protein